jgi:serine/threonine-protein kinase HipA
MPDTWGRTLMKRREAQQAKEKNEKPKTLYAIDFLLGVYDENRMGALRFKIDPNGDFLDSNKTTSTPPWSSIRELQNAASNFENDENNDAVKKWLSVLMAPGSSLGGARPKANILDNDKKPYPKELLLRSKNYIVCV